MGTLGSSTWNLQQNLYSREEGATEELLNQKEKTTRTQRRVGNRQETLIIYKATSERCQKL